MRVSQPAKASTVNTTVTTTEKAARLQIRGAADPDDAAQSDQIAQIIIMAPEEAVIGELIRFDLSKSVAQSFKWIKIPETVDFEAYQDGQLAVFSARKSGDYIFIIACAYNGTVDVATHTITITGAVKPDGPNNPDNPDDSVDPDDPIGPGEYPNIAKPASNTDLSQWIPYWCSINKCTDDEADMLAMSFESIADQIEAGNLQTVDDIVKATADGNRAALGNSLIKWLPVLKEFQTAMKTLANQGKLSTPEQHRVIWLEVAKSLQTYASLFN